MNVLRVFLMGVAAACALVAASGVWVMAQGHVLIGGVLFLVPAALSVAIFRQSQRVMVVATEQQREQFEENVRELAEKNGGVVPIAAIVNRTGVPRDTAEVRMRQLIGKGVFELDFGENGEVRYKLTPFDEARAQLAALQDQRTGERLAKRPTVRE